MSFRKSFEALRRAQGSEGPRFNPDPYIEVHGT